jgi:hypothetical protein
MKAMLVLAILLAGTALAFVPSASADTCASAVLEDQVCGAVYVVYCALGASPKQLGPCEVGAVLRILTLPPPN